MSRDGHPCRLWLKELRRLSILIARAREQNRVRKRRMDRSSGSRKNMHETEREIGKAISRIYGLDQVDHLLRARCWYEVDSEPSHSLQAHHPSVSTREADSAGQLSRHAGLAAL